jgi:isoleucyl-tRNA synthetase
MQRVPELIDVWFDSGAMPVAQWHYPFENQALFERQFPADFICEAVDQTRGWFYSLHAISTMVFESECFRNVICLGLVLDGEGQKMSKSRGNVIDPWEVLREHGADAFRWYLYSASPPGQERRFSAELVGEVVRNFVLPLWNVYAFFITYARLNGWQPGPGAKLLPLLRSAAYTPLDRWLLARLHALVGEVTRAYEAYDVPGLTRPIQEFTELLSNWYLRRSRRRFWKAEVQADQHAAYAALYETLVTLSKLLAPAMPFLAEEMYQNLVCSWDADAPESVHLSDWPASDASLIDEGLLAEMALVMKLVSLGHAARSEAGLRVRQPLSEAAFAVPGAGEAQAVRLHADLLADELNVRRVRVLDSAAEAVAYRLKPLPKQLGQKYKGQFPAVRQALLELEAEAAARRLLDGQSLYVRVEGETLEILPEEVEVLLEAHPGLAVASQGAYLAALATEIDPGLALEGLAREVVRRLQELRKQAGLELGEPIRVSYRATARLAQAIHAHHESIMGETQAIELEASAAPAGEASLSAEFDGERLALSLSRR